MDLLPTQAAGTQKGITEPGIACTVYFNSTPHFGGIAYSTGVGIHSATTGLHAGKERKEGA